jgi:hypothetical protein
LAGQRLDGARRSKGLSSRRQRLFHTTERLGTADERRWTLIKEGWVSRKDAKLALAQAGIAKKAGDRNHEWHESHEWKEGRGQMANEVLFKEESHFGHYPKLEDERLTK